MSAPYVKGDHDMPEWWSAHDDAILAGELAKLADLPRPAVPPTPALHELPDVRRRATPREIAAMIIVFAAMVATLALAFGPGRASTPAYPPGACGGQPAACADPPCAGDPASGCDQGFTTMPVPHR